ncbi:MAG: tryptophan synthase subunit alpha [Gammaproteobacteria bacterium]|nr:tryptophan synthase subunit alpha [Gammaproteobacteria bacterium]MDH5729018.1 tryptophan synthase subunit alpha [Gammaproteobacteria bacterium]
MSNRIDQCFASLKQEKRSALVTYIAAGDPNPELTVPLLHELVNSGADMIELGVPFSDPMADGPVIQAACERALAHGVTMKNVLSMVEQFRRDNQHTPIILMGYLNPIEVMGYEIFAKAAKQAGVDGVLSVDLPPEEGEELLQAFEAAQIAPIFLISPTTTTERVQLISKVAKGFVYYVSLKGVTGVKTIDVAAVQTKLNELGQYLNLPIGVGFGIKDPQSAAAVAGVADAVVVGSAIIQQSQQAGDNRDAILSQVSQFVKSLRQAVAQVEKTV